MKSVATISKTKDNKFRVRYYGINGEQLATSETLLTRVNCKKNICAVIKLTHGSSITVEDLTGKAVKRSELFTDGQEQPLDVLPIQK